jgi:hypothetical protein
MRDDASAVAPTAAAGRHPNSSGGAYRDRTGDLRLAMLATRRRCRSDRLLCDQAVSDRRPSHLAGRLLRRATDAPADARRLPRPPRAGRPLCARRPPADARAAERGAHKAGRRGGQLSARPSDPILAYLQRAGLVRPICARLRAHGAVRTLCRSGVAGCSARGAGVVSERSLAERRSARRRSRHE